jgi:predicted Rossmann fold flavoprotein
MKSKEKSVAIIGAGPAGCMCAYFASKFANVTLFDFSMPLHTLLYTGGGRCNLAYAEYDFKELTKFYPRGEKFLYSIFSRFSTQDTINFFNSIGVDTYTQKDLRIFPVSNSAVEVRKKLLKELNTCKFKKEKVVSIAKKTDNFELKTEKNNYYFDKVVIATGGHAGFDLAKNLGHKIIEPKPSLTGLITTQNLKSLQGVSVKQILAKVFFGNNLIIKIKDDLLFTHNGISGPLAYQISSFCARLNYSENNPLVVKLDFIQKEIDFQTMLNEYSKKNIKNILAEFIPKSLVQYILINANIDLEQKCSQINAKIRNILLKSLLEFQIDIISPTKEGEIVTSGGVCLDEINAKRMESKLIPNLYFCGEVIDIDGLCGGFNLQNCWSTGFITGNSL